MENREIDRRRSGGAPPPPLPLRPQGRRGSSWAEGDLFETCAPALEIAATIAARLRAHPGAALVVDYGHAESGLGETLQAVQGHRPVPVLTSPGEADITAHVDFAALARGFAGVSVWGPVTQGEFLVANGALLREAALTAGRDPATATAIRRAVRRLIEPTAMGRLFKVLVATSPGLPCPAGFQDGRSFGC